MVTRKIKKPRVLKEKPFAEGTMTNAAFFGMLRAFLRSKSRFWPPIKICRDRAKEKYVGPNKRRKWSYKCESCKGLFDVKNVAVHHIVDCGSLKSFEDLTGFTKRLFVDSDKLVLLCNKCHDKIHNK